jgi:hypothetical protein
MGASTKIVPTKAEQLAVLERAAAAFTHIITANPASIPMFGIALVLLLNEVAAEAETSKEAAHTLDLVATTLDGLCDLSAFIEGM